MKCSKLRILLPIFLVFLTNYLSAQKDTIMSKNYETEWVKTAPLIDGKLEDSAWSKVAVAADFFQNTPKPGKNCSQKTEVRMLYDDEAVYIAARMFETNIDSINDFLTERDFYGNADFFIVVFNNYLDGLNGEGFAVTPSGVQIDVKYSTLEESLTWDAVWESATQIDSLGWTAELKIPYSALRFPEVEKQLWGINFGREIRRNRERAWWNFVNPRIDGLLTQTGRLSGIEKIKPPPRLFFYPYTSAYAEFNSAAGGSQTNSFNGGMDVKYGLNDAFTLDMTLIPDFGQARFDNRVLNLSPFEVQFNENRQFFSEGVELFNKSGLFYSRRVGGRPLGSETADSKTEVGEELIENPSEGQLINATKISGRNKKGLGVGFFNAIENESFAVYENIESKEKRKVMTNPVTNYNVLVLDQILRKNSFLTFTNTNVMREGKAYDANASRLDLKLADAKNNYAVSGFAAMSHKIDQEKTISGNSWNLGFSKISGNFRFEAAQTSIGKDYDINDLGFQTIRNISTSSALVSYDKFNPFFIFNSMNQELSMLYERLVEPNQFANLSFAYSSRYTTRNFFTFGLSAAIEPIETNDFFESRTFDQAYLFPENYTAEGFISSDYSKPFALDARIRTRHFDEEDRSTLYYRIAPRFRPNHKLFFVLGFAFEERNQEMGYVTTLSDEIILGRRNVTIHESFIDGSYIFNNRMALSLNLRHYWSEAIYNRFNALEDNGELRETSFYAFDENGKSEYDVSFNAFNIDLIFRWRFAPGSEISVAWKNAISQSGEPLGLNYYRDLESTINSPQINNFSIKVLYFIDYLSLRK